MNIYIVTGAAGFIGSHFVESIDPETEGCICIDDFSEYHPLDLRRKLYTQNNILEHKSMLTLKFDISCRRNIDILEDKIKHYTSLGDIHFMHFAALTGVRECTKIYDKYISTNITGTVNMLELANRLNAKSFVFASSSNVYGPRESGIMKETDTPNPGNIYGMSKMACENILSHYPSNIPNISIARFFNVIGTRIKPQLVLYRWLSAMKRGKDVIVYGDGSMSRDFTSAKDVVSGCRALTQATGRGIYNICNSNPISLKELLKMVAKFTGITPEVRYLPPRPEDSPYSWGDPSKMKKVLGWECKDTISETIKEICDQFIDYGDL